MVNYNIEKVGTCENVANGGDMAPEWRHLTGLLSQVELAAKAAQGDSNSGLHWRCCLGLPEAPNRNVTPALQSDGSKDCIYTMLLSCQYFLTA